jgi:Prolyl oligopeptidase family
MTFDGPGQDAALIEHKLVLRPDWEAVLTPVLDAMLARPDVDPRRIGVIGTGEGGYLVLRALCFEHRFAAAVADPGILDLSECWAELLPEPLRGLADRGEQIAFDREMHLMELFSPTIAATLKLHAAPHGLDGGSRYALYRTVCRYRLDDELQRIDTPLLITEPPAGRVWAGQSQRLYDRLPGTRRLISPTGRFDQQPAHALRECQIYDWLDSQLQP